MHPLLAQQLREALEDGETPSPRWQRFLEVVDEAYHAADEVRTALERARDSGVEELDQRTRELNRAIVEYRAVRDAAPDAILIVDSKGSIEEINPAGEEMFGWLRDEVVGSDLADVLLPARLRAEHRQQLAGFLRGDGCRFIGNRTRTTGIRSDGTEFPLELMVTAHLKPGQNPANPSPSFTFWIRDLSRGVDGDAAPGLAPSASGRAGLSDSSLANSNMSWV